MIDIYVQEKLMLCFTPFNHNCFCCWCSLFFIAFVPSFDLQRIFFLSITFFFRAIHINCGLQKCVEMNSVVNSLVMLIFNFNVFQLTWSISRCWIYHLKRFIDWKIHCYFNISSGSKSIGDQWNAYIERKYLLDKLFFSTRNRCHSYDCVGCKAHV